MKQIAVIGSGIAGLASAIRLRHQGHEVTVYEANDKPGGKINQFKHKGYRWDMGPSLFTLPHLVDELFLLHGKTPTEYFKYQRKDNICNYFWEDGTQFSVPASEDRFVLEAAETFDESPNRIRTYLNRSKEKFALTSKVFLESSLHQLRTYTRNNTWRAFMNIFKFDLTSSLHDVNKRYFKNEKLVQLFDRYATYNGSSPFRTPGIMSMIPSLEMSKGTFYPKNGIYSIASSLHKLASDIGVQFRFNTKVDEVLHNQKRVKYIRVGQQKMAVDMVVANTDVFTFYKHLIKDVRLPRRTLKQQRSTSGLIFYWAIDRTYEELDLHNILFSDNYQEEFEDLFSGQRISNDPTIYINISSKADSNDAPAGCENWFVMINTPPNDGQDWDILINQARENIIHKINRVLKTDIEKQIVFEDYLDPRKIEIRTLSHAGSLYGTSSNSKLSAFLRHPNFSNQLSNLYFCGGSAHPGGGMPLCLLSAKIVSENIISKQCT